MVEVIVAKRSRGTFSWRESSRQKNGDETERNVGGAISSTIHVTGGRMRLKAMERFDARGRVSFHCLVLRGSRTMACRRGYRVVISDFVWRSGLVVKITYLYLLTAWPLLRHEVSRHTFVTTFCEFAKLCS